MRYTCEIEGCDNTNIASKGLCWKHYRRMLRHNTTDDPDYKNKGKSCSIEGCDSPARHAGLCIKHSSRVLRNGDPITLKRRENYTDTDTCEVEWCHATPRSEGLCPSHYANYRYHIRKGNIDNLSAYLDKVKEDIKSG